jgi:hypothetical protein
MWGKPTLGKPEIEKSYTLFIWALGWDHKK